MAKRTYKLVTPIDVAKDEKVNKKTVYDWIKTKRISPVYFIGKYKKVIVIGMKYKIKGLKPNKH